MAFGPAEPLFFVYFGRLSLEPSYLAPHSIMGAPMPRLRLRLSTLALLIVIIALATALLVQWRRERALKSHVQVLEAEIAQDRRILERIDPIHRAILVRSEFARQRQVNELRAQIARLSGEGKDTSPGRQADHGEAVAPKD